MPFNFLSIQYIIRPYFNKPDHIDNRFMWMSGDEGARTPDLGVANAALSQLSYIPTYGNPPYQIKNKRSIEKRNDYPLGI